MKAFVILWGRVDFGDGGLANAATKDEFRKT